MPPLFTVFISPGCNSAFGGGPEGTVRETETLEDRKDSGLWLLLEDHFLRTLEHTFVALSTPMLHCLLCECFVLCLSSGVQLEALWPPSHLAGLWAWP